MSESEWNTQARSGEACPPCKTGNRAVHRSESRTRENSTRSAKSPHNRESRSAPEPWTGRSESDPPDCDAPEKEKTRSGTPGQNPQQNRSRSSAPSGTPPRKEAFFGTFPPEPCDSSPQSIRSPEAQRPPLSPGSESAANSASNASEMRNAIPQPSSPEVPSSPRKTIRGDATTARLR